MTKEQWYTELLERCNNEFEGLKKYLEEKPMPYFSFENINGNQLEFKIGSRRVLLTYQIDLKNFTVLFKTYKILMNENEYGKYKLEEVTDLEFHSVPSETYYHTKNNVQITLPDEYCNKLEKQFATI